MADQGDDGVSDRGTEGLVRHLCRASVVDFRAVNCAEAARMLREDPAGEALAVQVEGLGDRGWAKVIVRVADALRPLIRTAITRERMTRELLAALRGDPVRRPVRSRKLVRRSRLGDE